MSYGELLAGGCVGFVLAGGLAALVVRLTPTRRDDEILLGPVLRAMAWVDAAIPDDLEAHDRVSRALVKADRFAKVFPQAFSEFYGRTPPRRVVRRAQVLAEKVCEERRRVKANPTSGGVWEATPSAPPQS